MLLTINKIQTLLFFVIFFLSCGTNSNKPDDITLQTELFKPQQSFIQQQIVLYSNTTESLYYIDSIRFGHPLFKKNGKYVIETYTKKWIISADDFQTPYLVYPNDTLMITKSKNSIYMYKKGDSARSYELNFFQDLVQKTGSLREGFALKSYQKQVNNLPKFYNLVDSIKTIEKKRKELLVNYFSTKKQSENIFIAQAKNIIERTALKDIIVLCNSNKALLVTNKIFKPLLDSCINKINNDLNETDFSFYDLVSAASGVLNEDKYYNEVNFEAVDEFLTKYQKNSDNFSSNAKQFLQARYIYTALNKKLRLTNDILDSYRNTNTDPNYLSIINFKINENKDYHNNSKTNYIKTINEEYKNLDSLIFNNKDSLLLLDFWASWCVPCRREFPFSEELKAKFLHKPIKFLYISTDKNLKDWIMASNQEMLTNTYLLVNAQNSTINNMYNLNTVPRYMLLGPKGKVINADAPRPSNPQLLNLITQNLKTLENK